MVSGSPEIFTFAGIIVFIALSLVTYYLRSQLPGFLPYIYQLVALGGLGQMYFFGLFLQVSIESRSLVSFLYFVIAITNIIGLSVFGLKRIHSKI